MTVYCVMRLQACRIKYPFWYELSGMVLHTAENKQYIFIIPQQSGVLHAEKRGKNANFPILNPRYNGISQKYSCTFRAGLRLKLWRDQIASRVDNTMIWEKYYSSMVYQRSMPEFHILDNYSGSHIRVHVEDAVIVYLLCVWLIW